MIYFAWPNALVTITKIWKNVHVEVCVQVGVHVPNISVLRQQPRRYQRQQHLLNQRNQFLFWILSSHNNAACTSVSDRRIYLCFNWNSADTKKCRSASDPLDTFTEVAPTVYEHLWAKIAAVSFSFDSEVEISLADILTVGSYAPPNKKAEIFLTLRNSWITISDYPFVEE